MSELKRSKRSAATKAGPNDNPGDEDPDTGLSNTAESSTASPQKKRRKVAITSKPRAPPKRAKLRYMTEMPLEILAAIFSCTDPRDLMHLTRANKALRAILLHRSALPVWQASLANLGKGFPECPPGTTIPQLVNFIYGNHCHYCSKKSSRLIVCWDMRINFCKPCGHQRFDQHTWFNGGDWLPCVTVSTSSASGRRRRVHYWTPTDIRAKYRELKDPARSEWIAEQSKSIREARKFETEFNAWDRAIQQEQLRLLSDARNRAKENIRALLRDMGWSSELAKLEASEPDTLWDTIEWDSASKQIIPEDDLQARLPSILQQYQRKRIDKESRTRVQHALSIIENIVLEEYSRTHCLVPRAGDVYQMEPIQAVIFEVFESSGDEDVDLDAERERLKTAITHACNIHLHDSTQAWISERKKELVALIPSPSNKPDISPDPETTDAALNLARNRFTFRRQVGQCLTWVQMMRSSHTHKMDQGLVQFLGLLPRLNIRLSSTTCKEERDHILLREFSSGYHQAYLPWNSLPQEGTTRICFDDEIQPIIETVIRGCKLDPATVTHDELSGYPMAFQCGNAHCYIPERTWKARKFFTPGEAIQHYVNSHRSTRDNLHSDATDYLIPLEDTHMISFVLSHRDLDKVSGHWD